jgi:hypothetical protein
MQPTIGQDIEESKNSEMKKTKNRHLLIVNQLRKRVDFKRRSIILIGR